MSQGEMMALEPAKYPKGEVKTGTVSRQKYKSGDVHRPRDWMGLDDEAEDPMFGKGIQRDRNVVRDSIMAKSGSLRVGKKYDRLRAEELAGDIPVTLPLSPKHELQAYGRSRNMNQLSEAKAYTSKPPNARTSNDFTKKAKYSENHLQFAVEKQVKSLKGRTPPLPLKGSRVDLSESAEMYFHSKNQGDDFSVDSRSDDWNIRIKKWKTERESPVLAFRSYKVSLPLMNDRFLQSDSRMRPSQGKIRENYVQNEGPVMAVPKGSRAFIKNEETESDSSEQFDDDEDSIPLMTSKSAYSSGVIKDSLLSSLKSGLESKKARSLKKNGMEDGWTIDEITSFSKKSVRENVHVPGVESYYLKGKHNGKMHESSPLHNSASRILDEVDRKQFYKLGKNAQLRGEPGDRLHMSSSRVYPTEKRRKGELASDHFMSQLNYLRDYLVDNDEEDASPVTPSLADRNNLGQTGKKGQRMEAYNRRENSEAPLLGCNKVTKKRKGKEYVARFDIRGEDGNLQSNLQQQTDDSPILKKEGKRKLDYWRLMLVLQKWKLLIHTVKK